MGVPHIQSFAIPHEDWQTDADGFDLINGIANNGAPVTNSMPWAGTIGRALIGHGASMGTGSIQIIQWPDGTNAGAINNPAVPFAQQVGIGVVIVNLNQSFNKDDGIRISMSGQTLQNQATRITLEVTFQLA